MREEGWALPLEVAGMKLPSPPPPAAAPPALLPSQPAAAVLPDTGEEIRYRGEEGRPSLPVSMLGPFRPHHPASLVMETGTHFQADSRSDPWCVHFQLPAEPDNALVTRWLGYYPTAEEAARAYDE